MGFNLADIGSGRVARMYLLRSDILGRREAVQIRQGIDPAVVLGQRWSSRLTERGLIEGDKLNVAGFYRPSNPQCFNDEIFGREEFFLLNSEGLDRRPGRGTGEIMDVATSIMITTAKLADYSYFTSRYGNYHDQVADAIRSLMSGDVNSWNQVKSVLDKEHRSFCIDLSGAYFAGLDFTGVDFKYVRLEGATFKNVGLEGADFSYLHATHHNTISFTNVTTDAATKMPQPEE